MLSQDLVASGGDVPFSKLRHSIFNLIDETEQIWMESRKILIVMTFNANSTRTNNKVKGS